MTIFSVTQDNGKYFRGKKKKDKKEGKEKGRIKRN